MIKKIVIVSVVFALLLLLGGGYYYIISKKQQASKQTTKEKLDIKEWKTYVSGAGFSVTYPAEWYLDENRGSEIPRIPESGPAFEISNADFNNYFTYPEEKRIAIFFNDFVDDLPNSPSNPKEKLKYYAEKHGMRSINNMNYIEDKEGVILVAHGMPRGYSNEFNVLMFYLPQSKKIATAIIQETGGYAINELLHLVQIRVKRID